MSDFFLYYCIFVENEQNKASSYLVINCILLKIKNLRICQRLREL